MMLTPYLLFKNGNFGEKKIEVSGAPWGGWGAFNKKRNTL